MESLSQLLLRYVELSDNGMGILDAENVFVFHNKALADMLGFAGASMQGRSHDDMMTLMFHHRAGIHIEAPTLDAWLSQVHARLRSAPFRSFEVDRVDGRWLMITEQVLECGALIMQCSDITRQKQAEAKLVQAHADLERLALTDELTGVPNRRHFLQQLDIELARMRRHHHPLCLAMVDLDHFKRINDSYGHGAGDQVLQHFARSMRQRLRAVDVVGRLGGEEFAILMPETDLDEALFVLRRVSAELTGAPMRDSGLCLPYTFSGGVATLPAHGGSDARCLLANADLALYRAKADGRDRINAYAS